MHDSLLISLFLFIVFAPCLVAFTASRLSESEASEGLSMDARLRRRQCVAGRTGEPATMQAMLPETALAEDFEIRSFPKGLSQRRIVVRDDESGVKLTIRQVRAAAAELVRIAGERAAYRFALMAAARAEAMLAVHDALAAAAREVLGGARISRAYVERAHTRAPDVHETWKPQPWIEGTQAA